MDPSVIAALLSVSVRVLDFLESKGEVLTDEELAARTTMRRALVQQAIDEGTGADSDPE